MVYKDGEPVDFIYLAVNRSFQSQTGLTSVIGMLVSEAIPGIQATDLELIRRYGRVATTGVSEQFEYFVSALSRWFSVSVYCPKPGFFVSIFDDITDTKSLENEQHTILDSRIVGIAKLKKLHFVWANKTFAGFLGYTPQELVGQSTRILGIDDQLFSELGAQAFSQMENGEVYATQLQIKRKDGSFGWFELNGEMLPGTEDESIWSFIDTTQRKALEEKIIQMAYYDMLTQLPNRRLFKDRLGQVLSSKKRSGLYGALLFIDLDNFKSINDLHGHDAGDMLLVEVGKRIKSCVREMDTVARIGGDEFVVLISQLESDDAKSIVQANAIAEKIRATLAEPYLIDILDENNTPLNIVHHCSASIGVVVFSGQPKDSEALLRKADMAMYQGKRAGTNRVIVHPTIV